MKDLSFYQQVGILLPGSALLLGLLFLTPDLRGQFLAGGVSVGGLGLFLLVAYALGHIVAAGGELLEKFVWLRRGRPSQWPVRENDKFLHEDEVEAVEAKFKALFGITVHIRGLAKEVWQPRFRQLYREVQTFAPGDISEIHNGNYGLNRGLAVAMLLVAIGCIIRQGSYWLYWALGFLACAAVYIYRMRLFGRLFAESVYRRFIQLPDKREPVKADKS